MHTPEGQLRERDLVLPANEYALILDQTKGHISVHTGPTKQSLSQTDQPVVYDEQTRRFRSCELGKSVQPFCLAQQGAYVQLENPSSEEKNEHPPVGSSPATPKLNHGQKVNIPGPVSFALWPGQSARVIQGHTLASNQYLLVRVYDDNAARENLETAVLKTVDGDGEKSQQQKKELIRAEELAIGKLIVIKGTEVNFFIPPTGLEVVPEDNGQYVREAVSLERLEYCLLLDQNGNKRYVRGPDVVFPKPTEEFVTEDGIRKFRAIELGPNSGIHIKVIAAYKEGEKEYQAGDELFITGKQTRIYFPREEHAIIRQNNQQIHHGVTLPRGEARYVLDKDRGIIELIKGPCIFLPDPRKQIIVKRVLTDSQCGLMYPGNDQALQYNRSLQRIRQAHAVMVANAAAEERTKGVIRSAARGRIGSSGNFPGSSDAVPGVYASVNTLSRGLEAMDAAPAAAAFDGGDAIVGDIFDQNLEYDQPQSITIDNKYDGAVTISPWTGYAIMVKNKAGEREVVMGPSTRILEYDEELEVLALSTGKPKSDSRLLKTVYLQVENNKVSDFIEVETSDFTKAKIVVSFRVNFIGDSQKWFNVANYTKLLCEHMRSKIRRAVMQHDVEDFYRNAADIVRDTVLGKADKDSKRGFTFSENNMHIYDVEVLEVELLDRQIQQLLADVQREGIDHALQRARLKREVEASALIEHTKREKQGILAETEAQKIRLQLTAIDDARALEKSRYTANAEARLNAKELAQADRDLHEIKLSTEALSLQQKFQFADAEQKLRIDELNAEAEATVKKANAVSPHLIKALQGFGDRVTIERLAHAVSPFGMIDLIKGKSIAETFSRLLRGSSLEGTASYIEDDIDDQAV
jgi:major vault protein